MDKIAELFWVTSPISLPLTGYLIFLGINKGLIPYLHHRINTSEKLLDDEDYETFILKKYQFSFSRISLHYGLRESFVRKHIKDICFIDYFKRTQVSYEFLLYFFTNLNEILELHHGNDSSDIGYIRSGPDYVKYEFPRRAYSYILSKQKVAKGVIQDYPDLFNLYYAQLAVKLDPDFLEEYQEKILSDRPEYEA